jgi:hypothetical protein
MTTTILWIRIRFLRWCAGTLLLTVIVSSARADALANEVRNGVVVSITRTIRIDRPVVEVFDFITADDVLPKILTGYGPLPAVVGTSHQMGGWSRPGSSRIVHFSDGTTLREQVTSYRRSRYFAYRVWDFGNPLIGKLSSDARGAWHFRSIGGGTEITWTYAFTARDRLSAIALKPIVHLLMRGYMDVCLHNAQQQLARSRTVVRAGSME